ncbi:ROK family protein [Saccharopolyspora hirsuta]|uniref:ROK family protein n=1 Tax=Saccharopolyspora hirsuta TaxID=1837 RepID=A0A5M7CHN9_SACHI|nr:ROK family protein [Saccharopolyspora hirsuta]KAA5837985.1 ROK family protein [Saccharopolyspora hirsuta]
MSEPRPSSDHNGTRPEDFRHLVTVLDLVRSGRATTRPELTRRSGLGRTVINQRVAQLARHGLVEEGDLAQSTGGRAARQLRFRADGGLVLVAELGATSLTIGATNLAGEVVEFHDETCDIADGPDAVLGRVEALFHEILDKIGARSADVWGIGIGLPGPVEFATGRPIAPPIMPGWDGYPVRDRLGGAFDAPVWVDNEVNLMALGEVRAGSGSQHDDILYVKIGTGIGAGLVSGGRLHRGRQGCAGDIGHAAVLDDESIVCRCGNTGCLEAVAAGAALARDGTRAAETGRSSVLAEALRDRGRIEASDVVHAATRGDRTAVELLVTAAHHIGTLLATLVSFYNPSLVIIGGGVAKAGDLLLATIRQNVYQRSLPLATRELRIEQSTLHDRAGLTGAAFMVLDELFTPARLAQWLHATTPHGIPALADTTA